LTKLIVVLLRSSIFGGKEGDAGARRPSELVVPRVAQQLLGAKYRAIQILDVAARVRTTATEITCAFRDRERRFGGERVSGSRAIQGLDVSEARSGLGAPVCRSGRGARRLEQGE
jgi:hypothetical protein